MDKLLIFPSRSEKGIFTHVIDAERRYLEKTAAEYHPTIASYIHDAKPIKDKIQVLLTALGAGEYWSDNANGDYFPEKALAHEGDDYGYKTFEKYARVFKHHVNKADSTSYGEVKLSVYNPTFHRVELITTVNYSNAKDIVVRIENGDNVDVSMGTRVPFDICSVCGNRAPTRKQYCDHARYMLGKIDPESGRKVYVINTMPRFFDISFVLIGADRIAKVHRKVASYGASQIFQGVSSALIAEKLAENAKAAAKKEATIDKEVPAGSVPPGSVELVRDLAAAIPEVKSREAPLPRPVLDQLGAAPLPKALSTLAMLGILPKPQEFQRIVLISMGRRSDADELDRTGVTFDPLSEVAAPGGLEEAMGISHRNFSPELMQILSPFMAERSYAAPHLGRRLVLMIKKAERYPLPTFLKVGNDNSNSTSKTNLKDRKPLGILPVLGIAAAMYAMLAKHAPKEALQGVDRLIADHPGLATALGLGLYSTFNHASALRGPGKMTGNIRPGEEYQNPDVNDIFARIQEQQQKPYMKVASIGPAAKRLFLGIPMAYIASGVLQKHRESTPHDDESRLKSFIRKNPDVVSGILAADAMLALKGKGTAAFFKKASAFELAAEAAEELLGPHTFLKTASAGDFLRSSSGQSIAIGSGGIPGRIEGVLFDQAAIEISRGYLKS